MIRPRGTGRLGDHHLRSWVLLSNKTDPLATPLIGSTGWSIFVEASGALAEVDDFRLQIVPEPAAATLALTCVLAGCRRRR